MVKHPLTDSAPNLKLVVRAKRSGAMPWQQTINTADPLMCVTGCNLLKVVDDATYLRTLLSVFCQKSHILPTQNCQQMFPRFQSSTLNPYVTKCNYKISFEAEFQYIFF